MRVSKADDHARCCPVSSHCVGELLQFHEPVSDGKLCSAGPFDPDSWCRAADDGGGGSDGGTGGGGSDGGGDGGKRGEDGSRKCMLFS